jgi:hypothetical protein
MTLKGNERVKHVLRRLSTVALGAAVTAATVVAAAIPGTASAATKATWKVDKMLPAGHYLTRLSAVSANDVWAVGNTFGSSLPLAPLVARWNGGHWQSIPAPAGATGAFTTVAATSATNTWAFLWRQVTGTMKGTTRAEHWTGSGWAKPAVTFPANVSIDVAVAAGPSNVWAFGGNSSGAPYAARYNGSKWSAVAIPAQPFQVSVISAKDIWAMASVSSKVPSQPAAPVIEHWNGIQWKTVALPHISLASQHVLHAEGIVAFGPGNVWAEFGDSLHEMNSRTIVLAHLTADRWTILRQPSSARISLNFQDLPGMLAGNARTGLWLHADLAKASAQYAFVNVIGTHWDVVADPSNAYGQAMAAVPGSGALVALETKYLGEPNGPVGVILTNGL